MPKSCDYLSFSICSDGFPESDESTFPTCRYNDTPCRRKIHTAEVDEHRTSEFYSLSACIQNLLVVLDRVSTSAVDVAYKSTRLTSICPHTCLLDSMASDSSSIKNDLEKDAAAADSDPSTGSPFSDSFQVSLDDNEDPQKMSSWRKWTVMVVLSLGALCATCLSSVVSTTFSCCPFVPQLRPFSRRHSRSWALRLNFTFLT
jgi:hypothetical protein